MWAPAGVLQVHYNLKSVLWSCKCGKCWAREVCCNPHVMVEDIGTVVLTSTRLFLVHNSLWLLGWWDSILISWMLSCCGCHITHLSLWVTGEVFPREDELPTSVLGDLLAEPLGNVGVLPGTGKCCLLPNKDILQSCVVVRWESAISETELSSCMLFSVFISLLPSLSH